MNPASVFKIPKAKSKHSNQSFEKIALATFRYQAEHNDIYKKYVNQLGVEVAKVKRINKIPFLPIEFFKTHKVRIQDKALAPLAKNSDSQMFLSSGTSGMERSRHHVPNLTHYEKSFRTCFELFYGSPRKCYLLSYLPSYYKNKQSSLLYMAKDLMQLTGKKESRFYTKGERRELVNTINRLIAKEKKIILLGVPHGLLELPSLKLGNYEKRLMVMETGGMKGQEKGDNARRTT